MSFSFDCSICSQVLHQPCCLTNCGHTFCLKCLASQVKQRPDDVVIAICPTCHTSSHCTEVENMGKEFSEPVVETLIEIFGKEKLPQTELLCLMDCGRTPEFWCEKCEGNLCKICEEEHAKHPFSRKHQVLLLSEKKPFFFSECPKCQIKSTLLCESCNEIVCSNCFVDEHLNHKFSKVESPLKQQREEFEYFIHQLKDHYEQSTCFLEQSKEKRKRLQEELQNLEEEIKNQTDRIRLLKTTVDKLELVNIKIRDEHLEVDTFAKLEEKLRKKLEISSTLKSWKYLPNRREEQDVLDEHDSGEHDYGVHESHYDHQYQEEYPYVPGWENIDGDQPDDPDYGSAQEDHEDGQYQEGENVDGLDNWNNDGDHSGQEDPYDDQNEEHEYDGFGYYGDSHYEGAEYPDQDVLGFYDGSGQEVHYDDQYGEYEEAEEDEEEEQYYDEQPEEYVDGGLE